MGREIASAAARWPHLTSMDTELEVTAICSRTLPAEVEAWYRRMCPTISVATRDYRELLASPEVDAVYVAVPHNLHREIYTACLDAGKHLLGEKPFGIDLDANRAILDAASKRPDLLVRCTSEFPFAPAVQALCRIIETGELGRVIAVDAGFKHSSDLNPEKPINWKRMIDQNGAYGVMGDLGMHVCHVPFRAGYRPVNVRAVLSNIMRERPDGSGGMVACETWDNAVLLSEGEAADGARFPMTLKMQRIAPGETNTWYLEILGTRKSVRFSTKTINLLQVLDYAGGEQNWCTIDVGHAVAFPSVTGKIFEFGFSDAMLQMMASYVAELSGRSFDSRFVHCVTAEETRLSHRLFTAALESQARSSVVSVE